MVRHIVSWWTYFQCVCSSVNLDTPVMAASTPICTPTYIKYIIITCVHDTGGVLLAQLNLHVIDRKAIMYRSFLSFKNST